MWARAHFPGDRYNITTSNITESLNRVLSHARRFPIISLLEIIRCMMTRWFYERRNSAIAMKTSLTRAAEKLLAARVDQAKLMSIEDIDSNQLQAGNGSSTRVVNLRDKKCSCRRFNLEKIPCVHAIAVADTRKLSTITLCSPYFQRVYLYKAYYSAIMPRDFAMPIPDHISGKVYYPPLVRQQAGRPKNSIFRSALEVAMELKRPRKQHKCGHCSESGHNQKTCRASYG